MLEELEGIDDLIGEIAAFGAATTGVVVDEERRGSAGELDEVDEVEANGAFNGGIGDLKEVDYRGSIVLVVNTKQHTQLPVWAGMLNGPPPPIACVFV